MSRIHLKTNRLTVSLIVAVVVYGASLAFLFYFSAVHAALGLLVTPPILYSAFEARRTRAQIRQIKQQSATSLNLLKSQGASSWIDRTLQPNLPLPALSGWALEPDSAGYLVKHVLESRPRNVVEFGSGTSTLLLAYALKEIGGGKITSFESNEWFAARTQRLIEIHNLEPYSEVIFSSLTPCQLGESSASWYDTNEMRRFENSSIDMVLVDGPPGGRATRARYPAVLALKGKLACDAAIFLDDADRKDEQEILRLWTNELPSNAIVKTLPLGKGLAQINLRF